MAVAFTLVIYALVTALAIYIYGEAIEPSIMDNFWNDSSLAAYIVRLNFLTIVLLNSTYQFMPCKIFLFNLIYEIQERTFSKKMEDDLF